MSNRDMLLDLALRCEEAAGADRALDFMILKRLRDLRDLGCGLYKMEGQFYCLNDDQPDEKHPPFPSPTASLDAALSLVPEGHSWTCYGGERPEKVATAYCVPRCGETPWPAWVDDICAATPALALCAAALRARAEGVD